jgi:DNA modification methylase
MARRTTTGKPAFEPVVIGDRAVGEALVASLEAADPVERATHGFHTYPAGMHPDAAKGLVAAFPGDSVLDPFCGGGTVLVEALLAGRRAVGRDVSPVALRVARARTAVLPAEVVSRFRAQGRKIAEAAKETKDLPPPEILRPVEGWYSEHVLWELEGLRRGIAAADEAVRPLLEAVFSSILVKTSWRKSDTSAQREKHDRPSETTAILFHKKVRELGRKLDALREGVPAGAPPADIRAADARNVRVDPVDLVLTSPPYPSTYDYVPLQHLRLIWLGEGHALDAGGLEEIGARRYWRTGTRTARKRWVDDTRAWTRSAAANLRTGGSLVILIGDGLSPAGTVDTSEATEEAGKAAGLTLTARASVERMDHARERARWEHAFAFTRA